MTHPKCNSPTVPQKIRPKQFEPLFGPTGIASDGVVDACRTPLPRRDSMKMLQTAIRAILLLAAAAGFVDNLGRASPRERALHVKVSSAFSTTPAR